MQILINKITGAMAEIPLGGDCGTEGNKMLVNPNIITRVIDGELSSHFIKGHCVYNDGAIVVLPEEQWSENQELE